MAITPGSLPSLLLGAQESLLPDIKPCCPPVSQVTRACQAEGWLELGDSG